MAELTIQCQQQTVKYFREDLGGILLDMVQIPSGSFIMGAPDTEENSHNSERPQHLVHLSSFFMGRYPITQAQWAVIARLDPIGQKLNPKPSHFEGDNRPVENVNWYDAIEFCARLSRLTQKNYRLPSEAEWEYACRAGTETPYHCGKTISTEIANYDGNYTYGRGIKGEYRAQTTEVDYFGVANAFGLSDMHGNLWEWCLDPWHSDYEDAPNDGRVWDEESKKDNHYQDILSDINILLEDDRTHVARGGSWDFYPRFCRSAFRNYFNPVSVNYVIGFRVICAAARTF